MATLVEADFKVGGKIRSNYNPNGQIGDAGTIEMTILAFNPGAMLALKTTEFHKGSPFTEIGKKTWSVFYFTELSAHATKITIVGLGYGEDDASKEMRQFFAKANAVAIDQLRKAVAPASKPKPRP